MNSTQAIVVSHDRLHENGLDRLIQNQPIVGLAITLIYAVVMGYTVSLIIRAFRTPTNPEDLMTDVQKTRWRAFQRLEGFDKKR